MVCIFSTVPAQGIICGSYMTFCGQFFASSLCMLDQPCAVSMIRDHSDRLLGGCLINSTFVFAVIHNFLLLRHVLLTRCRPLPHCAVVQWYASCHQPICKDIFTATYGIFLRANIDTLKMSQVIKIELKNSLKPLAHHQQ